MAFSTEHRRIVFVFKQWLQVGIENEQFLFQIPNEIKLHNLLKNIFLNHCLDLQLT